MPKSKAPRSRDRVKAREVSSSEKEALESLQKDIQTLENQKNVISRLMLELLAGYESLTRRVKASGDRTLAIESATNLKNLGTVYKNIKSMQLLSRTEQEFLDQYIEGLREASYNIQLGQKKVSSLVKKVQKHQKRLAQMQSALASMSRLNVEKSPDAFFDRPNRRESVRRVREVERKTNS